MTRLSVVVPIAGQDDAWPDLMNDLVSILHSTDELILVAQHPRQQESLQSHAQHLLFQCPVQILSVPAGGRSRQLNAGAQQASASHLWFLHCDSRIVADVRTRLDQELRRGADHLWYFDLAFRDGPRLTWLNAFGANMRSRILGIPFGDQGFCMQTATFWKLGAFSESILCGEDHFFVWNARRHGIRPVRIPARIVTSARKYQDQGWGRTTARHVVLTCRQIVAALRQRAPGIHRRGSGG